MEKSYFSSTYYLSEAARIKSGRLFYRKELWYENLIRIRSLWNAREDSARGVIRLIEIEPGKLVPMFNLMARWRIRLFGEQLERFEALRNSNEKLAPIQYKAEWMNIENADSDEIFWTKDITGKAQKEKIDKLLQFLDEYVNCEIATEEIGEFSKKFMDINNLAYPDDTARSRGKERNQKGWGLRAISNRLEKIGESTDKHYKLQKKKETEGKIWMLSES